MSPTPATPKASSLEPIPKYNARNNEIMAAVIQNLHSGIPPSTSVNLTSCAAELGVTEASMRVIWNKLRRKLIAESSGETTPGSNGDGTPATNGKKRKDKTTSDDAAGEETPTKKPRARKTPVKEKANGKKATAMAATEDEWEEGTKEDADETLKGEDDEMVKEEDDEMVQGEADTEET